ncbi:hypothetical protein Peur_061758 [Populus x canadensis]
MPQSKQQEDKNDSQAVLASPIFPFPFRVFPHFITVQEKMNNYFDRCLSDSCGEETPECRLYSEATSK